MHIIFPFKWPRQEVKTIHQQNKTTLLQQQEAKSVRQQAVVSHQDIFQCLVTGTLH